MSGDALEAFRYTEHDELVHGPSFYVSGVPFRLIAYPNGCRKRRNKGFVNLYIQVDIDNIPKHIAGFAMYTHLFCSLGAISWKQPITFSKLKKTSGKRAGWFNYTLLLSQYNDCRTITFCCYAEMINIEYATATLPFCPCPCDPICIDSECVYEWEINETNGMLQSFKMGFIQGQCHYSPNFNQGCFCLVAIPKGRVTDNFGEMRVFVKLLKLPKRIGSVEINCKLEMDLKE